MTGSHASPHQRAASAFARQVREQYGEAIDAVLLYGSVARGEERGVDSDVDLLVILRDEVDATEYEEAVRELAYDVELDHGVVLSLLVTSTSDYENRTERPFFEHVHRDAERLYG